MGTLKRSRARWIEQRKKASRYFCNLENRNFISKRMTSLINKDGDELFEPDKINSAFFFSFIKIYTVVKRIIFKMLILITY